MVTPARVGSAAEDILVGLGEDRTGGTTCGWPLLGKPPLQEVAPATGFPPTGERAELTTDAFAIKVPNDILTPLVLGP